MQAQRALGQTPMEERAMANREQQSRGEEAQKEKPKGAPVVSSLSVPSKPSGKEK